MGGWRCCGGGEDQGRRIREGENYENDGLKGEYQTGEGTGGLDDDERIKEMEIIKQRTS